jgi:hypothetical protein
MRKIVRYSLRLCRHGRLLYAALPMERAPRPPSSTLLVLDHLHGGGANAYSQQRMEQWTGTVALWRYVPGFGRYLITVREKGAETSYRCQRLASLEHWLERQDIRRVLVNNLAGWPDLDALFALLAKVRAGRLEMVLHDYLPVCPSYQLLNRDMAYCRIPSDPGLCARCLAQNPNALDAGGRDIASWRGLWRGLLLAAGKLTAPDPSVAALYSTAFPELAGAITVEPHAPLIPGWQPIQPPAIPLHIGVVGTITYSKGACLVRDIVRLLPSLNRECRLSVIGEIEAGIRTPGFFVTGRYRHEELPGLLEELGINVCLVPTIVPETFCYVALEIIQLGLPLVCLDIGAQGEKARQYAKGFPAPTPDAPGCLQAITRAYAACVLGPEKADASVARENAVPSCPA